MSQEIGYPRKWEALDRKKQFIIKSLLFCGMYFARDILGMAISYYIIYFVAVVIALSMTKEELLVFLISISAFTNAGFDGLFAIMLLVIVCIKCFPNLHKINRQSTVLLLICGYEISHFFLSSYRNTVGVYLTYVCLLLCLFLLLQQDLSSIDRSFALKSFTFYSLFFVMMAIVITAKQYPTFTVFFSVGFRNQEYVSLLQDNTHLIANANFITSICSLNMGIDLLLIIHEKKKSLYIIAFSVFVLCGLLTISKMFVAIIVLFVLYSIYSVGRSSSIKMIGLILIYSIATFLIMYFFRDTLIDEVLNRFRIEEITTGRLSIVSDMLKMMSGKPLRYLFGIGIVNLQIAIGNAVHGSIFEVLGGWGVIGYLLSISYIVESLSIVRTHKAEPQKRSSYLRWLPLIIYLVYSLIGMLFSSAMAMIRILVCCFAIEYSKSEGEIAHGDID